MTNVSRQAEIITAFRANHGRVDGYFTDMRLLLLSTTGATTGRVRIVPLTYIIDRSDYIVVAANAGSSRPPHWYTNLRAQPRAHIETGDETLAVDASIAHGTQRANLISRFLEDNPQLASYQAATTRPIPIVVLTPTTNPSQPKATQSQPEGDPSR